MGIVHRRKPEGWDWEGVPVVPYTGPGGVCGSRRVLIGPREHARYFVLRYFELPPGCRSSLDVHPHDHGVVVLRGARSRPPGFGDRGGSGGRSALYPAHGAPSV